LIDKLKSIGAKLPRRNREPVIGHSFEADNVAWPLRLIGKLVTLYIRLVERTSQVQVVGDGPMNQLQLDEQPFILLLWHGRNFQSVPMGRYFHRPIFALTSRSRDGAIIANIIKPFGFSAIQGSGTGAAAKKATNPRKRGAQAFRSMLKHLQAGHIVVATADVPPGPVFETGPGMVRLAAKSGAAIIPTGGCGKPEFPVVGTWDKLHLPLPFCQRAIVYGEPIYVAKDLDEDGLLEAQKRVDAAIAQAQADAAHMLGKKPLI
jgi:lysophospholipid acyltransferase (LPLAT)-like uncharacterized protein